jgi:hypothetical protein
MISELQFAGIAAFLVWCLLSSLCGVVSANPAGPRAWLIWRERGPAGWSPWREVHFGLSAADRRILFQTEPVLDRSACGALVDTVLQQTPQPESDAVQFAILPAPQDTGEQHITVAFVSDVYSTAAPADSSAVNSGRDVLAAKPSGRRLGQPVGRRIARDPSDIAVGADE